VEALGEHTQIRSVMGVRAVPTLERALRRCTSGCAEWKRRRLATGGGFPTDGEGTPCERKRALGAHASRLSGNMQETEAYCCTLGLRAVLWG